MAEKDFFASLSAALPPGVSSIKESRFATHWCMSRTSQFSRLKLGRRTTRMAMATKRKKAPKEMRYETTSSRF